MKTNELRKAYLGFFESHGHKVLPSASLVPAGDPTLLLTAAGMVPFKPFFLGTAKPDYLRVTTCQKCVRTPDIENVGRTTRHATFFEMLGNFSFGDYFKSEAIAMAWEFVTKILGFDPVDLWITIYLDDDEAFEIWNTVIGVPKERIVRKGKKDNFWEIGVGPCGPCSEIHVDRGPKVGCGSPVCDLECGCDRFMEIWNLVFIQFHRDENGAYHPLQRKGIDTGMGLERTAALLQGVHTIFDTDEMGEIRSAVAALAGVEYGASERSDIAIRVITDHVRGSSFMVHDGVLPSNEGRGYVLRRLLRRAARFGKLIGIQGIFLPKIVEAVVDVMKGPYPELLKEKDRMVKTIALEEERFASALEQGSTVLEAMIARVRAAGGSEIPGADAFRLYDTFGFPFEITQDMAGESGLSVDREGFDQAMSVQRDRARAARGETSYLDDKSIKYKYMGDLETEFVGYDRMAEQARITGILGPDGPVESLGAGELGEVVLDRTPFYPEGGGQVTDIGIIRNDGSKARVRRAHRPIGDAVFHEVHVEEGTLRVGDVVCTEVDSSRRAAIRRNHTATHLIHAALRHVLGVHVQQAGSLVDSHRLRFDFSHFEPVGQVAQEQVEDMVNAWVLANLPVQAEATEIDEARARGAMALFDEKYGKQVRVVGIAGVSLELCGGTHVSRTGDIGIVKIVQEAGIASGVRRIEAVTAEAALSHMRAVERAASRTAAYLKSTVADMPDRVDRLIKELRDCEKEITRLREKIALSDLDSVIASAPVVGDIRVVTAAMSDLDIDGLRSLADTIRARLGSGVILLGTVHESKPCFVAAVTADLVKRGLNAGLIAKEAAKVTGGGGGGRPDMASAGGKDPSMLKQALDAGLEFVRRQSDGQ